MSITVALGKKGSGKSALLRKICSLALAEKAALFYHDPQAQISSSRGRVYTSVGQWAQDTRPARLSIFRDVDAETVAGLALRVGDVTLVLDEMDEGFRDKRYASPDSALRRVIHYGRHHRVCLMGAFRRTPNVSEDLVSQCDHAFLFRLSSSCPQDILTIRQRFGETHANAVQALEFGQCILWQDDDARASPGSLQRVVEGIVAGLPKRGGPRAAAGAAEGPGVRNAGVGKTPPTPAKRASPGAAGWLPPFFS